MDGAAGFSRAVSLVTPPFNPDILLEMLHQQKEAQGADHQRLRATLTLLADRLDAVENCTHDLRLKIQRIESSPVEVSSLRLSPAMVFAIVMTVISLGGAWWSLQSSIAEKFDRLNKAQELQRIQLESLAKTVISQGRP